MFAFLQLKDYDDDLYIFLLSYIVSNYRTVFNSFAMFYGIDVNAGMLWSIEYFM